MRLDEVIAQALNDWFNEHEAGEDAQGEVAHIAAAVTRWLAEDAQIERMARAMCRLECDRDSERGTRCEPNCIGVWHELMPAARAAVAALGDAREREAT